MLALHGVTIDAGDTEAIASHAAAHQAAWRLVSSFPLPERSDAAAVYGASK